MGNTPDFDGMRQLPSAESAVNETASVRIAFVVRGSFTLLDARLWSDSVGDSSSHSVVEGRGNYRWIRVCGT